MNKLVKNRKYLAVNLILFAVLYLSITFNKEYIRPVFGHSPIIGIVTGSFPNFMAAYIISLFPIAPILAKNIELKKGRIILYSVSILVFVILSIEELKPMWGASTHYDVFDILASGIGSVLTILTFELISNRRKNRQKQL